MTTWPASATRSTCSTICNNCRVTSPFDRSPLQGALVLLIGAALYTVLLPQAIGAGTALHTPGFLSSLIGSERARFWAWYELLHTLVLLLVSLPFAWALSRLYARRLLPAAMLVVAPSVIWMVLDYLSMRQELLDVPALLNTFYAIDTAKVVLAVPLLSFLLLPRTRSTATGQRT
jgi:hypothetical protein